MRVKIVTDEAGHTHVLNAETNEEMQYVTSLTLRSDIDTDFRPLATLTVFTEIDVEAEGDMVAEDVATEAKE